MSKRLTLIVMFGTMVLMGERAAARQLAFTEQTALRLDAAPEVGREDPDEKDFAWGDVDLDGDIDLVIVRKQGWSSPGMRRNVLLMNEGVREGHPIDGVLVDRTVEFASATDVPGDLGFLTPTSDRDVILVDLDNDGWLDLVTAPAQSDGQPKHVSHPRVYRNLGASPAGWLGFRFENDRIPQMHPTAGPRFASVSAGDVTGDGYADLYFGDYDFGGPQQFDFNNRLLINDGSGFFTDQSSIRMTPEMLQSSWCAATAIGDLNGDGTNDIIKQTTGFPPVQVAVAYNNPLNVGHFSAYDVVYQQSPTFVIAGHLDDDGRLDLVITDDGADRYLMNVGNDENGFAQFLAHALPQASQGFGNNSLSIDLDNDGAEDILITDVDMEIAGCNRYTRLYRGQGGDEFPVFQEQQTFLPLGERQGTHDAAIFDIDGNGCLDLILGRCVGTRIWMNLALCAPPCPADTNLDGTVDIADLIGVILAFGPCGTHCPADVNRDFVVDVNDLLTVILSWGGCP